MRIRVVERETGNFLTYSKVVAVKTFWGENNVRCFQLWFDVNGEETATFPIQFWKCQKEEFVDMF